jgi:transcriptional regulator with XRE-family HTH domain
LAIFLWYYLENNTIMKKRETIRTFLGTSQNEMAILLKVSPGQWSMYESGKRKLPAHATLLLAEMLAYMQTPKAKAGIVALSAGQDTKTRQKLEGSLLKNEFEQHKTIRKKAEMQKKHEGFLKALQLTQFLHSQAQEQKMEPPQIIKAIQSRASKGLEKNGMPQLVELQAKIELLKLEEKWLKNELAKL